MKQLLFLSLLFVAKFSFCQNKNEQPVSVNIEILGKGYFSPSMNIQGNKNSEYYKNCYKARLEIVNNEDTILPITIWTCSWVENWHSNNDSIYIQPPPVCTANYPTELDIPSKKSLVFYTNIFVKPKTKSRQVKIGFTNMNGDFKKMSNQISFEEVKLLNLGKLKGTTYWSEEISLDNYYYEGYFIK